MDLGGAVNGMTINRATLFCGALCLLAVLPVPALAQDDTTPPTTPAPGPDASADAETPPPVDDGKEGLFGKGLNLFIDVAAGQTQLDPIVTSIETSLDQTSSNLLQFDGHLNVQFEIGWKFTYDRGYLSLVFDAYGEQGYKLDATGNNTELQRPPSSPTAAVEPVPWWFVSASDGKWTAQQFPPIWVETEDDANGNGQADPDEIRYESTPVLESSADVPESLQNNWQTWDLVYRRLFGKKKVGGVWSMGMRYFQYDGNLLATAWLGPQLGGVGYSDAAAFMPLSFRQETSGWGPIGSLGIIARFFRDSLEVYGEGQVGFILSKLRTETGEFFTVVRDGTLNLESLYPAAGDLEHSVNKDVWQLTGKIGVRYYITDALSIRGEYFKSGYQDSVLTATRISVPQSLGQVNRGTSALYNTTDLRFDGFRLGLRFQF